MAIGKIKVWVTAFEMEYETEDHCESEADFGSEAADHVNDLIDPESNFVWRDNPEPKDRFYYEVLEFKPDEPEPDELDTLDPPEEEDESSSSN